MKPKRYYTPALPGLFFAAVLLCSCFTGLIAQAQQVKVSIGEGPFFIGDSIRFEVRVSGTDVEPTIEIAGTESEGLKVRFLDSGQQSFTQIINGRVVQSGASYNYSYVMDVSEPGDYSIGPFQVKAGSRVLSHPPLNVTVSDIELNDQMKLEVNFPAGNYYPGQRIPIELAWKFSGDVQTIRELKIQTEIFDRFQTLNAEKRQARNVIRILTKKGVLQLPATYSRETDRGETYQVLTVKSVLVVDRPQSMQIPAAVATCRKIIGVARRTNLFDLPVDRLGGYKTIPQKAISEPISVNVLPFPSEGRPSGFSGAIGEKYSLSTSVNRARFRVGDPVSLQLEISGVGNLDAVGLPEISSRLPPEKFDVTDEAIGGVVSGDKKQFTVPFRVKDESVDQIPPIRFSWFDPSAEQYVTVESKSISLDVSEGKFITSDDVVRPDASVTSKNDLMNADLLEQGSAMLDLSIESDVSEFRKKSKSGFSGTQYYVFYVLGGICILIAILDRRRVKPKSAGELFRDRMNAIRTRINALALDDDVIENLGTLLRELQSVGENWAGEDEQPLVDSLISKCDEIAFRPTPPSEVEKQELQDAAKRLMRSI